MLNIHRFISLCLVVLLIACSPKPKKPNIIIILADDLGWSDLGCYGSEISTPNLDHLANNGMRFTQFYNTAKCFPSRACLLTGVYAQDCGYDRTYRNPITNALTFGEVLRDAGYQTYWSGKHHGLENPIYRGFDRYYGLKDGACNHFNPGHQRDGEAPPAQKKGDRAWCIDSSMYRPYTPTEKNFYTTDYFTHYGLAFLEEAAQQQKPFLLYLAYTAPHDPLMAWQEDIDKYSGAYDEGYEAIRQKRFQKQQALELIDTTYQLPTAMHQTWDSLSLAERDFEVAKMEVYAAMIDRLDQNIGRVLKKLEALNLDKNTLILFLSDNGASAEVVDLKNDDDGAKVGVLERWVSLGADWANVSNTPFNYYKNYSFEGGINTPFIAYWKDKIKPNSFSDFTGHFIDVMPTFMELSGATYSENDTLTPPRGQSLVPVFLGKSQERTDALFWEWSKGKAVRKGDWKIVKRELEQEWELYNLKTDPTERENLYTQYPEIVQQLDSLYLLWENSHSTKEMP
ncbi:MAG: arylsulfatase [Bacteroidota bacterium]